MITLLLLHACQDLAPRPVRVDVATSEIAPGALDGTAVVAQAPARRLLPASAVHLPGPPRSVFKAEASGFTGRSDSGRVAIQATSEGIGATIDDAKMGRWAVVRVDVGGGPTSNVGPWTSSCTDPAPPDCERRIQRSWGDVVEWWQIEKRGIRLGFDVLRVGSSAVRIDVEVEGPELEKAPGGHRLLAGQDAGWLTDPVAWHPGGEPVEVQVQRHGSLLSYQAGPARREAFRIDPVLMPDDEQARFFFYDVVGFDFKPAGDTNGDGFADSLVEGGNMPNYWLPGSATGWVDDIESRYAIWYLGSVASGPDVDGDGVGDIISCDIDYDAWLFSGVTGSTPVETWRYEPPLNGGGYCHDAEIADVNGDGYGDVVVSDFGRTARQPGYPNSYGWLHVFPGGSGFETLAELPKPGFPGKANQGFADEIAKGDFNNDGYDDIATQAGGCASPFLVGNSDAWIFHGGPNGLSPAAWSWRASFPGIGCELIRVEASPDINGDGFDDLLLWGKNAAWWAQGTATGASIPVRLPRTTWAVPPDPFYYKANALGDINADGYGDIAIMDAEGIHVHLGGPDGPQLNAWGRPMSEDRVLGLFGVRNTWYFGPLGDVNGDGFDDFGMGNYALPTEPGNGLALLYFGRHEPDIDLDGVPNEEDCQPYRWWSNQYVAEIPGNLYDDDCDGTIACFLDLDGDGHGGTTSLVVLPDDGTTCEAAGYLALGPDCHDADPTLGPQTPDMPDNDLDEDCDGLLACHLDYDADGYGALYEVVLVACSDSPQHVMDSTDCDDTITSVHPGSVDVPSNGNDDDCDGDVACWADLDGDGYGGPAVVVESHDMSCYHPGMSDYEDCGDDNPLVRPGQTEVVGNGLDDDCDGWHACNDDLDGDGYGAPWAGQEPGDDAPTADCAVPGKADDALDCDDTRPEVHPGGVEQPYDLDGIDANCDGWELCYPGDLDGDRHAPPGATALLVQSAAWTCPPGYGGWATDCAEGDPAVSPGHVDISSNAIDEDCDGRFVCSPDADGDGHGDLHRSTDFAQPCRLLLPADDCDDALAAVHPGALEVLNDLDDDCDQQVLCTVDDDEDDYFGSTTTTVTVQPGEECTALALGPVVDDCNDRNDDIHPGAKERTQSPPDENCDGIYGLNLLARWVDATTLELTAVANLDPSSVVLTRSTTGAGAGPCHPALAGQCSGLLSPAVVPPTHSPNGRGEVQWVFHIPPGLRGRSAWWQVWNLTPGAATPTQVVQTTVP